MPTLPPFAIHTRITRYLMVAVALLFFYSSAYGQATALNAAEIIEPSDTATLTFHKVTDGLESSPLDLTNPATSFRTGDIVRVKYKASYDSYVYIVNSSNSGGTTLQYPRSLQQNVAIPANDLRAFSFRLTNREAVQGPVRENLIVIISRTAIKTPSLDTVLENSLKLDQVKKSIAQSTNPPSPELLKQQTELEKNVQLPKPPEQMKKFDAQSISVDQKSKTSKTKTFARIACGILSGWLGGLFRIGCSVAGLGAAEFMDDSMSNSISATPSGQTNRLFFRLSFEHSSEKE